MCVHCAGKLRLVEIAGGGCGHQADHPRRATQARGAREREEDARTAGSVDVRVSVRATEETLRDFARAKRPAVWRRAA